MNDPIPLSGLGYGSRNGWYGGMAQEARMPRCSDGFEHNGRSDRLDDRIVAGMLEIARQEWERTHGPTDWSKYRSPLSSSAEQERLFESDPQAYIDGLPPFMRCFLTGILRLATAEGYLDDIGNDRLLACYIANGRTLERRQDR